MITRTPPEDGSKRMLRLGIELTGKSRASRSCNDGEWTQVTTNQSINPSFCFRYSTETTRIIMPYNLVLQSDGVVTWYSFGETNVVVVQPLGNKVQSWPVWAQPEEWQRTFS